MISIDTEKKYLIISRCDYLYRNGISKIDNDSFKKIGDGDIVIPLPEHFRDGAKDNSDGMSLEIIISEIRNRLGLDK